MDITPPFSSFGFADDLGDEFKNPFMNPSDSAKQTKVEQVLTPVSNSLSRSSTDSFLGVADKRIKIEDDDDHTALKKRKKSDAHDDKDEKRNVLLQKNRVAAQKCREKKKKETEGMMQRCEQLERDNEKLKRETKLLTEETNNLKMMIMGHVSSTPGCGYFNDWIESQAQAVIRKKIHSHDSLESRPSILNGRNESIASTTSMASAGLSPHQDPSFSFDDELNAQVASWSMQPQSLGSMDTSFTAPMDSYSTVSLSALQACDPIDPSLTMAFSPVVKDESEYSFHSLPGRGTPEALGTSPQPTIGSVTRAPSLAADSVMVSRPNKGSGSRRSSLPGVDDALQASDRDHNMTH